MTALAQPIGSGTSDEQEWRAGSPMVRVVPLRHRAPVAGTMHSDASVAHAPRSGAAVESYVLVRDVHTGESQSFQLVGHGDADASHGKVSIETALGRAVHGRHPGALVQLRTTFGLRHLHLLAVEHHAAW